MRVKIKTEYVDQIHPASGLLLEAEMEVSKEQGEILRKAGLVASRARDSVATESPEGQAGGPAKSKMPALAPAKGKE